MSIALGKVTIDGIAVTALSPQSPLGTKLMGLSVADVGSTTMTMQLKALNKANSDYPSQRFGL